MWTKEIPTEPGFYWWRNTNPGDEDESFVCELSEYGEWGVSFCSSPDFMNGFGEFYIPKLEPPTD